MKAPQPRPSCANRIPTLSHCSPPAPGAELFSGGAAARHRDGTMSTKAQPMGSSHGPWDLRALFGSLNVLLRRGKSDCPTTESEGPGGAKIIPQIAVRPI